jgi:hypothetical protein
MFDHFKNIDYFLGVTRRSGNKHFVADITAKKILDASYWWPTLFKDIDEFCKSCDNC